MPPDREMTPPIRVLHVVSGRLGGGAARGAYVLSEALRALGVQSHLLCADPAVQTGTPGVSSVSSNSIGRAAHIVRARRERFIVHRATRGRERGFFSAGATGIALKNRPEYAAADIVHLHWINGGMLSIDGIAQIGKPCVWTMRDMWPFTGGCHYALDCSGYTGTCASCPELKAGSSQDLSERIHREKAQRLPGETTYVGISNWIADCAKRSSLLGQRDVRCVLNAIDVEAFRPMPKEEARARLNLPGDAAIVLLGALSLDDTYKGYQQLRQARDRLTRKDLLFCSFGHAEDPSIADRNFGLISEDEVLRQLYAAADILVFPSIQEAFGKVAAEAIACGTPVVAFDGTGPTDIVLHQSTGYLARPGDSADFAAGIEWCLADPARLRRMSAAAAEDARTRFAPETAARAYVDIYREKLGL